VAGGPSSSLFSAGVFLLGFLYCNASKRGVVSYTLMRNDNSPATMEPR
jgi:hypothetical protein